jgi:uncharacterized protein involved in outer membrane biogenesis
MDGSNSLAVLNRHRGWFIALAVLVLLTLTLALFDWNLLKGPIERRVASATGREFRIDGELGVDWGFPPTFHAQGLHLANARWSANDEMASVGKLAVQVRFLPLLRGRLVLPFLAVDQPHLLLERNDKGVGNWVFKEEEKREPDSGQGVQIRQLTVARGRLQFREPTLRTALALQIDSASPAARDQLAPLLLKGDGSYRAVPFDLSGKVDSPLELRGKSRPYRVDLRARAGETRAHVSGQLLEPLQLQDVGVDFELAGADLAQLYELVGIALPTTPPYQLKGKLARRGNTISYHDFTGRVGDSDLEGDVDIKVGGKRPRLTAKLKSKLLDFDDLAGFIGGTPAAGPDETASAQQVEQKARQKASGRVLPANEFHLAKLRSMDADVTLHATRIKAPKLPLETMSAHLLLDGGLLKLAPLDFNAASGVLKTSVELDARKDLIHSAADIDVRGLDLGKLLPTVKSLQDSYGSISGVARLEGDGNSMAAMLGDANGDLSLIMGSGRMSNLLLELAGLDIAESLKYLLGRDKTVVLRCAYADFGVADGLATTRAFAFDTADTELRAHGTLNFKDESLDLTVLPRPKDFSPITLRSPLRVGGHFADPSFLPKPGPLLLRSAIVAGLAAITPPAALLGLIETGPGKDTDCGAAQNAAAAASVTQPATKRLEQRPPG